MVGAVQPKEVVAFSETHPDENFYQLEVGGAPLGYCYRSPEVFTVGWPGVVDFSSLHREALKRLPSSLGESDGSRDIVRSTTVGLILKAEELEEFELGDTEQYTQYKDALKHPDDISFARYDIHDTAAGTLTFTADNPRWHSSRAGEMTIQLPRARRWPDGLAQWVVDHHQAADVLKERTTAKVLAYSISRLSRR